MKLILLILYLHCVIDQIYSFSVCALVCVNMIFLFSELSHWYFIVCLSMLWFYTILFQGECCYILKRLNPLHLFAPIQSQKHVQWLSFVDIVSVSVSLRWRYQFWRYLNGKLSTDLAHTSSSSRLFQWIKVLTENEFLNCSVLQFVVSIAFELFLIELLTI